MKFLQGFEYIRELMAFSEKREKNIFRSLNHQQLQVNKLNRKIIHIIQTIYMPQSEWLIYQAKKRSFSSFRIALEPKYWWNDNNIWKLT